LSHVDAKVGVSISVLGSQLSHSVDGRETGILGQSVRYQFECVSERPPAVLLRSSSLVGLLTQSARNLHLGSTTTGKQESLLDEASDDTEGVVEGAISLLKHQLVGSTEKDGDGG
ncbi:hypothetical protein PFISCL1PPCAC_8033, partial [Pristionchus fissidentatus]